MLLLSGKYTDKTIAYQHLEELIHSGLAFEKLKHWIEAQGGNVNALENTDLLPGYIFSQTYNSKSNGYIQQIKASKLGLASVKLGAGREKKGDIIDFGAGIILHKKVGSQVVEGENLATLYTNNEALLPLAVKYMDEAYQIGEIEPTKEPLIYKIIR
jgi:thymidine phosphorylase